MKKLTKDSRNTCLIGMAQFISDLGNWFYTVAISTLVYALTGSATALSLTIVSSLVPSAIFSIVGGGMSDQHNPKKLMILSDMVRALMILLALFVNESNVYLIYLISFVNAILGSVFTTSRYVLLQKTLSKESLGRVFSKMRVLYELAVVMGSLLGGVIYSALGFKYIIILDCLSFCISLLCILFVKFKYEKERVIKKKEESFLETQMKGFSYIRKQKTLVNLVMNKVMYTLSSGIMNLIPSLLAIKIYGLGSNGVGLIYVAIGIGSLVGAYYVGKVGDKQYKQNRVLISGGISCIGWLMLMLKGNIYFGLIAVIIINIGDIFAHTYMETYSVVNVDQEYIGRISGVFQFITYICLILSLTILPQIIDRSWVGGIAVSISFIVIVNMISYVGVGMRDTIGEEII